MPILTAHTIFNMYVKRQGLTLTSKQYFVEFEKWKAANDIKIIK